VMRQSRNFVNVDTIRYRLHVTFTRVHTRIPKFDDNKGTSPSTPPRASSGTVHITLLISSHLISSDLTWPVRYCDWSCPSVRTSTIRHNAATNQIVVFVKVDETFTTIWVSRSSEVRVKVRRWPQSPFGTIFSVCSFYSVFWTEWPLLLISAHVTVMNVVRLGLKIQVTWVIVKGQGHAVGVGRLLLWHQRLLPSAARRAARRLPWEETRDDWRWPKYSARGTLARSI